MNFQKMKHSGNKKLKQQNILVITKENKLFKKYKDAIVFPTRKNYLTLESYNQF